MKLSSLPGAARHPQLKRDRSKAIVPPGRRRRRLGQVLPFLLVCLAGAVTAVLQAAWKGLELAPTGVLLLVGAQIFCLWGLWHWRSLLPLLPAPPWQRTLTHVQRREQRQERRLMLSRWQLMRLALRTSAQRPPPVPRPARDAPLRLPRRPRPSQRTHRAQARRARPMLNIQFVSAGRSARLLITEQELHTSVMALVSDALRNTLSTPPALLALHDEPRRLVCQLAASPIITGAQQREISRMLQVHGVLGSWSDDTMLRLRRDTVLSAVGRSNNTAEACLWVPAVRTRQGQMWWPLPRTEHLVIAGQPQAALSGAVGRLLALSDESRPTLLVHDPDGRLQEFDDQLARLPVRADALAAARHMQLEARFTYERGSHTGASRLPLLIVVTPASTTWPDLAPLLAPGSGIQVVLVLGDREPMPVLRATCHRLPVIEAPDIRFPALPDAFRPASVPAASSGQALAWLPGGQQVWRGVPSLLPATRSDSSEVA